MFSVGNVVLFKYQPAIVQAVEGDKFEIVWGEGKSRKVRDKDLQLLHVGPLKHLPEAAVLPEEWQVAWELMAGEQASFAELLEMINPEATALEAVALWELMQDRLHFKYHGDLTTIEVVSAEEVEAELAKREAKAGEAAEWEDFCTRLKSGDVDLEKDARQLQEIEKFCRGLEKKCKALQAVGKEQVPEAAHQLLLKIGYWDQYNNPYPTRFGLPETSPDMAVGEVPEEERLDLTHLAAYAVDDEGSTDPDDAISVDGDYLWVHVADAAALIPPRSDLDLEAMNRGTNQYIPERMVTMLPEQVVPVLGLGLQEISPALSFGMRVTDAGELEDIQVVPTLVKVTRTTYDTVEQQQDQPWVQAALTLTDKFRAKRIKNGAPAIRLPEVKVVLDENRQVVITPLPQGRAREMVTDAMLMAGEAAATFALRHDLPIPFATQQMNGEVDPTPVSEDDMAAMFGRRKLFKRSQMKTVAEPHAGLGLELYARATSPLRRYPDLVVHQQLRLFLAGEAPLSDQEVMMRVASFESVAGSAAQSERISRSHWKAVFLLDNPDWQGEAVVVDEYNSQFTLLIPELGLEWRTKPAQPLQLNERVTLAFQSVDLPTLSFSFKLV